MGDVGSAAIDEVTSLLAIFGDDAVAVDGGVRVVCRALHIEEMYVAKETALFLSAGDCPGAGTQLSAHVCSKK